MIAWLEGVIIHKSDHLCIVNVAGVGYEVELLLVDSVQIPAVGQSVQLHIAAIYREDIQQLYGFCAQIIKSHLKHY